MSRHRVLRASEPRRISLLLTPATLFVLAIAAGSSITAGVSADSVTPATSTPFSGPTMSVTVAPVP
jgi:hypothetical protein